MIKRFSYSHRPYIFEGENYFTKQDGDGKPGVEI
jgi:hypothetical protein